MFYRLHSTDKQLYIMNYELSIELPNPSALFAIDPPQLGELISCRNPRLQPGG